MRDYEMMLILRADLSDEDLSNAVDTVQGWIENGGGTIANVDRWGRRRLAYQIDRQRDGFYLLYTLDLPAELPAELERNLRINENVLRHLIIRKGA